jgi:N,N-dimethylformamidase
VTDAVTAREGAPAPLRTLSYARDWSVPAGGTMQFMVACLADTYDAEIIRITGRGPRPPGEGPALSYDRVGDGMVTHPGEAHQIVSGSYGVVDDVAASRHGAAALAAWIYPTLPAAGRHQTILAWLDLDGETGVELGITSDRHLYLSYRRQDGLRAELSSPVPLEERRWCFVGGSVDPSTGRAVLVQDRARADGLQPPTVVSEEMDPLVTAWRPGRTVLLAAGATRPADPEALSSVREGSYNGKIEQARAWAEAKDGTQLLLTAERAGEEGLLGRGAAGIRLVNAPMERMTGHHWSGHTLDWRVAPSEYEAVWFHDDDLADADWPVAFEWRVPPDAPSGMYAARLVCEDSEEVVSFYVRPAQGQAVAPVAVLIPTFTYTAYSNFAHPDRQRDPAGPRTEDQAAEWFLNEHLELGLSHYCRHRDGSGVSHVSWRRPMLDMRPWHRIVTRGNAGRELSGDLYLLDWLEHQGIPYDTITDGDLHAEGVDLLSPYAAVLTGGHPEYVSEAMLDALGDYTASGGHLAYLGGNGFYWVTSVSTAAPHVLEVRRGRSGSRTWTGEPGEGHHTETGEPGGHWRERGRAPQVLFGVGFCAQGGGPGAGYVRTEDSAKPEVGFVFEGIGPDEVIGDFGLKLGGAAGDELDRADFALGTPPATLILATSAGLHNDTYQHAVEEVQEMNPREGGTQSPLVRADMTYVETAGGGAVFSVGSIAWSTSLSYADYDNNVSRLTANVVEEFTRRGAPSGRHQGSAVSETV